MELVFLIYGLAFFLLGFAILYYPKKNSAFHLARHIHLVGWFGIFHGINEWLDLLILVDALNSVSLWKSLQLLTLPVSFLFLVYFGCVVMSAHKKCLLPGKLFPLVIFVIWGILFLAGEHNPLRWDVLSRYVLCFPGALLTGLGLLVYVPESKSSRSVRLTANLKIGGITFIAYAVLAGLIVKDAGFFPSNLLNYGLFSESLGIPVQVFRSLCAVVIAYNLIRVMEIFHLELQQSLSNSEARFRTVVNNIPVALFIEDENNRITFLEGKGLESLHIRPPDAVGKSTKEVFSEVPQVHQISRRVLSLGEEVADIVSVEGHFFEVYYAPLKGKDGVTIGCIGVMIDVTEQKKAQNEIDKYRIEMEKSKTMATIGALSAEIAVEITGPLHDSKVSLMKAIRGLRRTIGGGDITASIQEGIDRISQAIKTLSAFGIKAELQHLPPPEPIDLFETVQRILSVFRESAQHSLVRITTEGTDIFPVTSISSRELEQVLYIMIQNVIRSADGSQIHNLNIDFSVENKTLCVRFSDKCLNPSDGSAVSTISYSKGIGTDERSFDFSVVKGIVDTYSGTMTTIQEPDGVRYEIQLPLAEK